jgi:tetratricopeptide (TPR) repeat protein
LDRPPVARRAGTWAVFALAVAAVLSVYGWILRDARQELGPEPQSAYYNLLVRALRAGRVDLPLDPPAGFSRLPDPYDPVAIEPFRGEVFTTGRIHDLTYYRGRLYLYFGITPALLVFGPSALWFGVYLSHANAILIFSLWGFAASGALVVGIWRRYFPAAPAWLAAAGVGATGLATTMPLVLQRPEVWEVAVTCGYAMLMVTLLALWRALHSPRTASWLAAASTAYGLALGARPSLLLVAPILFVPVALARWGGRDTQAADAGKSANGRCGAVWRLFLAAAIPVTVLGLGLLAYNYLRFDRIWEFGQRYQLSSERQMRDHFALAHFPTNFRIYFLRTATWTSHFPFFKMIPRPGVSADHGDVEFPYGILTNTPWVWLALAAPLAWRGGRGSERARLRVFVLMVFAVFAIMAVANTCYYGACVRYQQEFTPALTLLAVVGWFGLHAVWSDCRSRRRLLHALAVVALLYSAAFTSLYGWIHRSFVERTYGSAMLALNRNREALAGLRKAVRIAPDFGELHFMLGCALTRTGELDAGRQEVVRGAELNPKLAGYFVGFYGQELTQAVPANRCWPQLQQLANELPNAAEAQNLAGDALANVGRLTEAIDRFRAAVRLNPRFAEAYCSLGLLLAHAGSVQPAVDALQTALELDPKQYHAHLALGRIALAAGNAVVARNHFEAAARLNPAAEEPRQALQLLSAPQPGPVR